MGCGGSKEAKKDDKTIDSKFEYIDIIRFDSFFRSARDLLDNAEKIRSGLEDSKERGVELTQTHKLQDPKYTDVVQVLLWTLSAEAGGKINDTGVKVGSELPFIKLEKGKVSDDTFELYQTFSEYIKTVVEGPATLKDIIENLQELSNKCPDLIKEGKTEIQNSSLSFGDKAKAIANLGKNGAKLPKELAKCQKLQEIIKQAGTDLKELAPKFQEHYKTADEIGVRATAEGIKKPGEVFDKYHTGPRKPPGAEKKKDEKKKEEKKN